MPVACRIILSKCITASSRTRLATFSNSRECCTLSKQALRSKSLGLPGKENGKHVVNIENAHGAVLDASGLASVPYDFRDNFATRLAEIMAGDVVALKAIRGQANLLTVMRYVHTGQAHQDAAMEKYSVFVQEQNVQRVRARESIQ